MLPLIWPSSILKVATFDPSKAEVGDIICFMSPSERGVARRIVKIEDTTSLGRSFQVKEDRSDEVIRISTNEITYVVLGIANRSVSFSTQGTVGKAAAHLALAHSAPAKVVQKGIKLVAKIADRIKSESPF